MRAASRAPVFSVRTSAEAINGYRGARRFSRSMVLVFLTTAKDSIPISSRPRLKNGPSKRVRWNAGISLLFHILLPRASQLGRAFPVSKPHKTSDGQELFQVPSFKTFLS